MTGSILQFLAFWPCGHSFPFILALVAFSFHFGLVGLHFLAFWPFGPSFPFIFAFWAFISFILALWWLACGPPPTSCQKRSVFPMSHIKNLAAPGPAPFSTFWPSGPSFPFILALWAFISFYFGIVGLHFLHFGLVGLQFLLFWHFGPSFPFILAFWAFISFHFGLLGLHLAFWPFRGRLLGVPPPQVAKNGPFSQCFI